MDIIPSGEFPHAHKKRSQDQEEVFFKGEGKTVDILCRARFIAPGSSQTSAEGPDKSRPYGPTEPVHPAVKK
jgi:hypothetical protein